MESAPIGYLREGKTSRKTPEQIQNWGEFLGLSKDGTPYFPKPEEMDLTIKILEKGIKKSKISNREKLRLKKIKKFNMKNYSLKWAKKRKLTYLR